MKKGCLWFFVVIFILAIARPVYRFTRKQVYTKPVGNIQSLVGNSGTLPPMPQAFSKQELGFVTETKTEDGMTWVSQSKKIHLANKIEEITPLGSTHTDALYPGALLQGKQLAEGKLTEILTEREPITISINNVSREVEPNRAAIHQAITDMLPWASPSPAQMTYARTEAHTGEQAMLELGVGILQELGGPGVAFQGGFKAGTNSVFLCFKQVYYSVNVNRPSVPADFFDVAVNVSNLQNQIGPGNPPCYISQVDYGRLILVKVTSQESALTIGAAIKATLVEGVGGRFGFNFKNYNLKSTFDALVLGGSANGAAKAVTAQDIKAIDELIRSEAVVSAATPGFPIAYKVRYLSNGEPVPLGKELDYTEAKWVRDIKNQDLLDFYFSHFEIIDDGSYLVDGKFYYQISVLDKQGNVLKNIQGREASIETTRNEFVKAGSGQKVTVLDGKGQILGVPVPKGPGESFTVQARIYDFFASGDDKLAGTQGETYNFPWSVSKDGNDWKTMPLLNGLGSYKTSLVFKVLKKSKS